MKKTVLFWVMAVMITAAGANVFVSQSVYAVCPSGQYEVDGTCYYDGGDTKAGSATYFNWGDGSIMGVINLIMDFLAAGVGIIAVVGIIYGGIQYSLALGDKAKVSQAIGVIRSCVVALILAAAWGAIMFFIRGGLK